MPIPDNLDVCRSKLERCQYQYECAVREEAHFYIAWLERNAQRVVLEQELNTLRTSYNDLDSANQIREKFAPKVEQARTELESE